MKISYLERIFGDALAVKKLYMKEFAENLEGRRLTPEQFDKILYNAKPQSADYPKAAELIQNPELYTRHYNQLLARASFDGQPVEGELIGRGEERIEQLTGKYVARKLEEFFQKHPEEIEIILADFHSKVTRVHISSSPETIIEKINSDEPIFTPSPNTVPKITYALLHLHQLIERETG